MTSNTISCPSCGGPNKPEAGAVRMACAYCGTTLAIPESMRVKDAPKAEKIAPKPKPTPTPEIDAPDLLRKAQPAAVKAWNLFAYWTRLRRLIPACLTVLVIGFFLCAALGALPIILGLSR
jgi:hypothetical protein